MEKMMRTDEILQKEKIEYEILERISPSCPH
jgi:hypothetical protein